VRQILSTRSRINTVNLKKYIKKQKNLFAFAVAVNPTLDPTALHPQNSKSQRKTEKALPQGEQNEPRQLIQEASWVEQTHPRGIKTRIYP